MTYFLMNSQQISRYDNYPFANVIINETKWGKFIQKIAKIDSLITKFPFYFLLSYWFWLLALILILPVERKCLNFIQRILDYLDDCVQKKFPHNGNPNNQGITIIGPYLLTSDNVRQNRTSDAYKAEIDANSSGVPLTIYLTCKRYGP